MKPHKRLILVDYVGKLTNRQAAEQSQQHERSNGLPAWHYVIGEDGRLNNLQHYKDSACAEDVFSASAVHVAVLSKSHRYCSRAQELALFELLHHLTQSKLPQAEVRCKDEFADTPLPSDQFNIRDWMNQFDLEAALIDVHCAEQMDSETEEL